MGRLIRLVSPDTHCNLHRSHSPRFPIPPRNPSFELKAIPCDPESRPATILLMVRDLENRILIRNTLSHRGCRVVEAANEYHAEILCHNLESKLDLVVTDAQLSRARTWGGQLVGIRVILTLADSVDASDQEQDVPATVRLDTPLTAEEIALKVQSALTISKRRGIGERCLGD